MHTHKQAADNERHEPDTRRLNRAKNASNIQNLQGNKSHNLQGQNMETKLFNTFAIAPTSAKTHAATRVLNQWRGLRNWTMWTFLLLLLSMTGVIQAQVT